MSCSWSSFWIVTRQGRHERHSGRTERVAGSAASSTDADSYSARLVADPLRAAQKVGEEGVEVVIAALAQDRARLISESADLVFHLLALLQARDVRWSEVEAELRRRRHPEDGQP